MDTFKSLDETYPESDFSKIGFPGADGNGAVFYTGPNYYGMNTNSLNQDAVWTFLKFLLSTEKQETNQFGFPVLQVEFDKLLENAQKSYSSKNDAGESVVLDGLTEAQVESLRTLINSITAFGGTTNESSEIMGIIFEEAKLFFARDKDAQQTAEVIQNRVNIYLSEQQ